MNTATGRSLVRRSNPAAMTVTRTSSPRRVVDDGAEDDVRVGVRNPGDGVGGRVDLVERQVGRPAIESRTPLAPSIEDSSSGDEIAAFAASRRGLAAGGGRCPSGRTPPRMTDFTSAKSRLMRPGV